VHDDHEQFAAMQVALVGMAEQATAVPEQPPSSESLQPPTVHAVASTLLEQAGRVPLQASASAFHVQPVRKEHSVALAETLHGVGVPEHFMTVGSLHVQPLATHEADDAVAEHAMTMPEQTLSTLHAHPVSAAQLVDVVLAVQDHGTPVHRPPVGYAQPGTDPQLPRDIAAQEDALGVPTQREPVPPPPPAEPLAPPALAIPAIPMVPPAPVVPPFPPAPPFAVPTPPAPPFAAPTPPLPALPAKPPPAASPPAVPPVDFAASAEVAASDNGSLAPLPQPLPANVTAHPTSITNPQARRGFI